MPHKNPEDRKAYQREYLRGWRERNPDYNRKWREQNPDHLHKRRKANQKKNNLYLKKLRKHRSASLQRLARMFGCVVCRTHDPDTMYCWHHPGVKNFELSDAWRYGKVLVRKELKLVMPLCMSCHSKHHGSIRTKRLNLD